METNIIIGLRTQLRTHPPINTPLLPTPFLVCVIKHVIRNKMARRYTTRRRTYARRSRTSTRRRVAPRKRTTYRRGSYRKRASRKALLNVTSRKKRDTMLTFTNTTQVNAQGGAGASQTSALGSLTIPGTSTATVLWNATARDLTPGGNGAGVISNESSRTATTCYMRGLSEHLRITTSSGIPWFHRRICFTFRGALPYNGGVAENTTSPNPVTPFLENNNGMVRLALNQQLNNTPNSITAQQAVLFKGRQNIDWVDLIAAPVDTARVTLKFDKTWCIHSGNAAGTVKERKLWHPMNHNLVYDDDENGSLEDSQYTSVQSKAGMGDYFVYDIIQPGLGANLSDIIVVNYTASLYWHER